MCSLSGQVNTTECYAQTPKQNQRKTISAKSKGMSNNTIEVVEASSRSPQSMLLLWRPGAVDLAEAILYLVCKLADV